MSNRDEVKSPAHYNQGGIECIDAIRAALTDEEFRGYCKGNAIKYIWRERMKGGDVSLEKGVWYMERAVSESESEEPPLMKWEDAELEPPLGVTEGNGGHICWLPLDPNSVASDLPLNVIDQREDMICVPCEADGWIDWPGGTIPLPGSTMVEVELRGGLRSEPTLACNATWGGQSGPVVVARFRLAGLEGGSGVADGGGYGFVGGI